MKTLQERFDTKYEVNPSSGCWEWTAFRNAYGYGLLKEHPHKNSKILKAHRISYTLHKGVIPEGMFVCHSCDNPSCVNPAHLWLGTPQDNMDDKMRKGRSITPGPRSPKRGDTSATAKLTTEQAIAVKQDPRKQREIAVDYGISQALVSLIKLGKQWSHLP